MAHWKTHILCANWVNENFFHFKDDDFQLFLWGNLLPDVNNGYNSTTHKFISQRTTHFDDRRDDYFYNSKVFYDQYYNEIVKERNPLVTGYLFHLWTDKKINIDFVSAVTLKDIIEKGSDIMKSKWNDIMLYTDTFEGTYILPGYKIIESVVEKSKAIAEIDVNEDDLYDALEFLLKPFKTSKSYSVYSEERLSYILKTICNEFCELF